MDKVSEVIKNKVSRRKFLAGVGTGLGTTAALAMAAGCGSSNNGSNPSIIPNPPTGLTDADILNFALNLEYLEAEFYLRAVTGSGLSTADAGAKAGAVTGGSQVTFTTPALQAYAIEIAADELAHVRLLRKALADYAVSRPAIDLQNSFNAAAVAAGIVPAGGTFNPFADEASFIVGAFVFEDVGVTAYHGAVTLFTAKGNVGIGAALMATEAYHAAEIRTVLTYLGDPYLTYANQISALRATAGGGNETPVSGSTIVPADSNSIAYDRTTDQVLHIVYLSPAAGVVSSGGFFPSGMNGKIAASAS